MNSGLPSLIDAIFGKQDLASVSLEELYEVVNEFPSFNAVHFLLSKKLDQENNAAFEKESMRTALYFNNPLWLQSILEHSTHTDRPAIQSEGLKKENTTVPEISPVYHSATADLKETPAPGDINEGFRFGDPVITVNPEPATFDDRAGETETEDRNEPEQSVAGTVTSFDELMSKYNIQVTGLNTPEPVIGTAAAEPDEKAGLVHEIIIHETKEKESVPSPVESTEEVLNEYGIFEEVDPQPAVDDLASDHDLYSVPDPVVDHDLDAFDRPYEKKSVSPEIPVPEVRPQEIAATETDSIVENQYSEKSPEKSDDADYASFDRPLDSSSAEEQLEESHLPADRTFESMEEEANDTNGVEPDSGEAENEMNGQVQELVSQFGEKQKSMPFFDAKKAEAIVFAPYHMIDYFASQGIKLVLEDHPADNFGKQLKSFTDWLKVMKKLPAQPTSDKQNEKEADRIRHFAEHSVEERDILTESMAEVLAKQGMYENAIALYQKLSLIYPPKSAYFASRIEQLKASLS